MTSRTRIFDCSSLVVKRTDSFSSALGVMSRGGYQLGLVVDDNGKLVGMVTDSDVRKALLRGVELNDQVAEVMNRSPLAVSPELGDAEANKIMIINHFFHLPIVNEDGKIIGLHVIEQLKTPEDITETIFIMAGGKGKRLMPLTETLPKPMLKVDGKPILQHVIEKAADEGFRNFQISVNYLSHTITDYFGDGSEFGVKINYIKEDVPLGTAGSLSLLPKEARETFVVVTNADVITDVSFTDMLIQARQDLVHGLMAVRLQEWQNPFGVVHSEGNRMVDLEEKPVYRNQINAGIYVVSPELISLLKSNEYCDMTDLFRLGLKNNMNLNVFPMHESWIDVGRPDDYKKISEGLSKWR